mmetsp:Transcript_9901/g.37337  ORF Transcript_9901/g.37337 Transcript_9901/m.37337 type:complete len:95 (-) Transcript_9901:964-1248(-)
MTAVSKERWPRGNAWCHRSAIRHGFFGKLPPIYRIIDPDSGDPRRLTLRNHRVSDNLKVTADLLYINDRVEDAKSGEIVYGNRNGVPYVLQRIE